MSEPRPPFKVISNLEVVICLAVAALIYWGLFFNGRVGWGIAIGGVAAVQASVMAMCRPIWTQRWFRIAFAILLVAHSAGLSLIDWSFADDWNGLVIMPFMAPDTMISVGFIYSVFLLVNGRPESLFVPEEDQ